jgi:predicted O-methyltransferase YrrM
MPSDGELTLSDGTRYKLKKISDHAASYVFSEDWFTFHVPHWRKSMELAGLSASEDIKILEIGSYEGRSSTWISDNLLDSPGSSLCCIDTFGGSIEHEGQDNLSQLLARFSDNIALSKNANKVRSFVGDSKQVMPVMIRNGWLFDLIYVDGSHEEEHVVQDGLNAFELLAPGGIIIFDDYHWEFNGEKPVMKAVERLEKMISIKPIWSTWQRSYVRA